MAAATISSRSQSVQEGVLYGDGFLPSSDASAKRRQLSTAAVIGVNGILRAGLSSLTGAPSMLHVFGTWCAQLQNHRSVAHLGVLPQVVFFLGQRKRASSFQRVYKQPPPASLPACEERHMMFTREAVCPRDALEGVGKAQWGGGTPI